MTNVAYAEADVSMAESAGSDIIFLVGDVTAPQPDAKDIENPNIIVQYEPLTFLTFVMLTFSVAA